MTKAQMNESETIAEIKDNAFSAFDFFIAFSSLVMILYLHVKMYFKSIRKDEYRKDIIDYIVSINSSRRLFDINAKGTLFKQYNIRRQENIFPFSQNSVG